MTVAPEHQNATFDVANVSSCLRDRAAEAPDRIAVREKDGRVVSFAELEARVDRIAHGLLATGLRPGDRACVFVRPSADLIALTHAMFRTGILPVLIDPGMGRKSLLACVERVAPRGLIGIPRAHVARRLFPRSFATVEVNVTVGPRIAPSVLFGGRSLARLERDAASLGRFEIPERSAEAQAAVLFTSGSTGPPKGVEYTHANFVAQLAMLRSLYDLKAGEVDVACFPLFALFDNALGMTSVFPDMDPSRPAQCDPQKIYDAIERSGATFTFGSPAIWARVAPWAAKHGKRFSTLRRLTIAGAPVAPKLVDALRKLLPPDGDVHTPYGATEALPVSSVSGREIVEVLRPRIEGGEGTCVGRPVPGVEVELIRITDEPIERWSEDLVVPRGTVGEICVRGPMTTPAYLADRVATRAAKIQDGRRFWHRMGDVGRIDRDGRLWLHGRKSHRIETLEGLLMPVPIENVYLTAEGVRRAAVVGLGPRGREVPLLVIEPEPGADEDVVRARLKTHRRDTNAAGMVKNVRFKASFPVDVRHNAKIRREDLKAWAEGRAR